MGLTLTRVRLAGFRSYEDFELLPDPEITVLVGPNATGKTNFIEAVQILTSGQSFRRPLWQDTVKWGAEQARLSMQAEGDSRQLDVQVTIDRSGRREFLVNGKNKRRIAEATRNIPCVVFTPDDLRLVKDSAQRRRNTVDDLGVQLSEAYGRLKSEYDQVVRQRNTALKDRLPASQLDVFTEVLVDKGTRLVEHRRRLTGRIAVAMKRIHAEVASGSDLETAYLPSWERDGVEAQDDAAAFREHLVRLADEERRRGVTLSGPHRDDIRFELDGRSARTFASQGQQRTIALAFKLAEVDVVKDVASQRPVLLLDDVMSELDEHRRAALAEYVGTAAQTFVTTTHTDYFDPKTIENAKLVQIG